MSKPRVTRPLFKGFIDASIPNFENLPESDQINIECAFMGAVASMLTLMNGVVEENPQAIKTLNQLNEYTSKYWREFYTPDEAREAIARVENKNK